VGPVLQARLLSVWIFHHNPTVSTASCGPQPQIMLSLPADIQFLIVDCIVSKSDLKALCRTSKTCCDLARPRLYHHIQLKSWDRSDEGMLKFIRCAGAGALKHLRFIRHLTIEDSRPPSEPPTQQIGPILAGPERYSVAEHLMDYQHYSHDKLGAYVVAILVLLPPDQLRSFW